MQHTSALGADGADAAVTAAEGSRAVAGATAGGGGEGGGGSGGEGGGGVGPGVAGGEGRGEDGIGKSSSSHGQMFTSDEFFRPDTMAGADDFRTTQADAAAAASEL